MSYHQQTSIFLCMHKRDVRETHATAYTYDEGKETGNCGG